MGWRAPPGGLHREQPFAVLHGLAVLHVDLDDFPITLGVDLVHELHRLDDAEHLPFAHLLAHVGKRLGAGLGRAVEGADDRGLHDREVHFLGR
jgi:hypothetical protein